ncbi:hypothetical protein V6N13_044182 [Hibiscus sabdariffa]
MEVKSDRDRIRSLCEEKDAALQAALLEKNTMEVRLGKLSDLASENNAKGNKTVIVNQSLQKLQDELKLRNEELHKSEERAKRLTNEKVKILKKSYEQECNALKLQDIDRKNEQTAAILKMQGAQLAEFEALYTEEQVLRKR